MLTAAAAGWGLLVSLGRRVGVGGARQRGDLAASHGDVRAQAQSLSDGRRRMRPWRAMIGSRGRRSPMSLLPRERSSTLCWLGDCRPRGTGKAGSGNEYEHAQSTLYHALGDLPEPDWLTHRFG